MHTSRRTERRRVKRGYRSRVHTSYGQHSLTTSHRKSNTTSHTQSLRHRRLLLTPSNLTALLTYFPPPRIQPALSNMDKRSDVPKLDTANYGPWLVAIRAAAHTIDCINHITGNSELPQDPNQQTDFQRNKHFFIGKIISSIPPEIANFIITPTSDPTPFELITATTAHPDTTNTSDHKYLKQLAEQTIFLPDMTLSQYVTAHETIRTKMIAARYPSISDLRATVEFLIDGLRFNPVTSTVSVQLISLDPEDVNDFVHKFNRITSYTSFQNPTSTTQGYSLIITTSVNQDTWRTASSPRRLPRRISNPCRFHQSRGIPHPAHRDYECRYPQHPRHQRKTTTKQYTQARAIVPHAPHITEEAHEHLIISAEDNQPPPCTYTLDYGAHPSHVSHTKHIPYPNPYHAKTYTATNASTHCTQRGQASIKTNMKNKIRIPALVTPKIRSNLLSVHDITIHHGNVLFTPTKAIMYARNKGKSKIFGTAPWNHKHQAYTWSSTQNHAHSARTRPSNTKSTKLAQTKSNENPSPAPSKPNLLLSQRPNTTIAKHHNTQPIYKLGKTHPIPTSPSLDTIILQDWNLKLNHAPTRVIQSIARQQLVHGIPRRLASISATISCSACAHAKQRPFPHKPKQHTYKPSEYISSDTCGPINPLSLQGHLHFLSYIDAASRYLILFFLKDRREVGIIMPQFFK